MPFGGPGSYRRQGSPSIEQILVQFNTSSVNFPCSPPRTSFPVEDPHQGADPRPAPPRPQVDQLNCTFNCRLNEIRISSINGLS
jgi:hypothetical protein